MNQNSKDPFGTRGGTDVMILMMTPMMFLIMILLMMMMLKTLITAGL